MMFALRLGTACMSSRTTNSKVHNHFEVLYRPAGIKVHDMRQEDQNISEHAVASTLVFDRVELSHLPDTGP